MPSSAATASGGGSGRVAAAGHKRREQTMRPVLTDFERWRVVDQAGGEPSEDTAENEQHRWEHDRRHAPPSAREHQWRSRRS
eukprot:475209-Pleurochrysis_carterae.AAC.2